LPRKIRVSYGSALVLRLLQGKIDAIPSTIYLMTYTTRKCAANCGFCSQARTSRSKAEFLSRIMWPIFRTEDVLEGIVVYSRKGLIKRVCIQALNYPKVFFNLIALIRAIKQRLVIPVSLSCPPPSAKHMLLLKEAGLDRIGIALDAATERIFEKTRGSLVGGPYTWNEQLSKLHEARSLFGKGNVSTHLIVGLGETEEEMILRIQQCMNIGVLPALFAFTPIRGTALENNSPPSLSSYRHIQLARYLIVNALSNYGEMCFDDDGVVISYGINQQNMKQIVKTGKPFLTSGCPNCNRPFYNEKPSGPLYNYPRSLRKDEIAEVKKQLGLET